MNGNHIQSLLDKKDRLELMKSRILDFPKFVSYDCFVPLSCVAFLPGKIIHTNEFKLKAYNHEKIELQSSFDPLQTSKSYFEVAHELDSRISLVDKLIQLDTVSAPQNSKASPPKPDPLFNTNELQESPQVFEIKEFLDENNQIVENEIVNVSREMRNMMKKIESSNGFVESTEDPNQTAHSERKKKLLEGLQGSLNEIEGRSNQIETEEQQLIRDLARMRASSSLENDTDTPSLDLLLERGRELAEREQQWEQAQAESEARNRIRAKEAEYQRREKEKEGTGSAGLINGPKSESGGWKKGFLGSPAKRQTTPSTSPSTSPPSPSTPSSSVSLTSSTSSSIHSLPSPSRSGLSHPPSPDSSSTKPIKNSPTPLPKYQPPSKSSSQSGSSSQSRSSAFSGAIIEKGF